MNDDIIQDLKQFIATTVSQQTSDLREDMQKMESRLTNGITDLSVSIGETIEASHEPIESQLQNHEKRITKLEKQPAR